jgi:hypothetical protein
MSARNFHLSRSLDELTTPRSTLMPPVEVFDSDLLRIEPRCGRWCQKRFASGSASPGTSPCMELFAENFHGVRVLVVHLHRDGAVDQVSGAEPGKALFQSESGTAGDVGVGATTTPKPAKCPRCSNPLAELVVQILLSLAWGIMWVYLDGCEPSRKHRRGPEDAAPRQLEVAADFVHRLKQISREERLARTAGALSPDEADEFNRVIEEGCEEVDEHGW